MTEEQVREAVEGKILEYSKQVTHLLVSYETSDGEPDAKELADGIIELVLDNADAFGDPKGCGPFDKSGPFD